MPAGPLAVDLRQVSFAYNPAEPVLKDLTLHIPAGRVLGIAGRTGSGKTTIGRLIPRFVDPQQGTVELGRIDIRDLDLAALRQRIGIVSQEVHLFTASVRDNLTLFDSTVPDSRLLEILTAVGLETWLQRLPDGLDTIINGGGGLSAGQAQLLACSRLLLQDPAVVILDEASARLDPASERLLHEAIGRLLAGRTGIIIAHRVETFAFADDILVLDQGKVIETGSRDVLAADPASRFATLLPHQRRGDAAMTRPLTTWRCLVAMQRYAPMLCLAHALGWSIMNLSGLLPGLLAAAFFDDLANERSGRFDSTTIVLLLAGLAIGRSLMWMIAGSFETRMRFTMSAMLRRNLLQALISPSPARSRSTSRSVRP